MIEIIIAAGWPIWPIIFCSVISVAIIAERFYSLRREAVVPNNLLGETVSHLKTSGVTQELISKTGDSSPLGRVFVAGLKNLGNTCYLNACLQMLSAASGFVNTFGGADVDESLPARALPNSEAGATELKNSIVGELQKILGSMTVKTYAH